MYCTGCGTKLEENAKVCSTCGKPVQQPGGGIPVEEPVAAPDGVCAAGPAEKPAAAPIKSKKKVKILPVALAAVLVAAAVAVAVFWGDISNLCAKTFMSADDYYLRMEKMNLENTVAMMYTNSEIAEAQDKVSFSGNVSLEAGDGMKDIYQLAAMSGQLDWLQKIDLGFDVDYSLEALSEIDLVAKLNDTEIISADLMIDVVNDAFYAGVPQLLDSPLKIVMNDGELQTVIDEMMMAYSGDGAQFYELSKETLESLLLRYLEIIVENLDDIRKESAELKVGELSKKCTLITITIDGESLKNVMVAVLGAAKNDTEIKEIICGMAEMYGENPEDYYAECMESIDVTLQDIADTESAKIDTELGGPIVVKNWIDGSGRFAGREIDAAGSVIMVASVETGKDVATEISVKNAGFSMLEVSGTGVKGAGNLLNGQYVIEVQGDEVAILEVKNFDTDAFAEGSKLSGEFYVSFGDDVDLSLLLGSGVPDLYLNMLEQLSVGMIVDSNGEKAAVSLMLLNEETTYLTLKIDVEMSEYTTSEIPADEECVIAQADDQLALQQALMGISFNQLMENLKAAGVPEELVNALFASLIYGGY